MMQSCLSAAGCFSLVFLLSVSIALGGEFAFFEPVQPPRAFQVMVHRGAAGQAPENTRLALLRCVEDGFEWAEVDVRLTRDGHHVLAHDPHLSDGRRTLNVAESTLAELQELDVGSAFAARFGGEAPLSLGDCFALAKGRLNLYLDAKVVNPEQLAREIVEAGLDRQVVVYDTPDRLQRVRAASAGRLAMMAKWRPGIEPADWVRSNHLAAVEIDADQVSPEICRSFRALGVKVQTKNLGRWDVPAFWDRVLAFGVDWVQTDLPEELLAHALWRRLPQRPVRFALHRGASRYAPENTIPALEKAWKLGADFVEFDVRTTRDGRFYLLHDRTLEGKTDGTGPIEAMAAEAVARLSAGVKFGRTFAEVKLPTLDEFLAAAAAGRADLYFDAKAIPPEALAAAVQRHHVTERTVVYQAPSYLARLKAIDPRIRLLPPLGDPKDLETLARELQPFGVDAVWEILSKELIARCHALGIKVFSDALGAHERIEDYQQAMDWGIDVIQTDHPVRLFRALESLPPRT